MHIADVSAYVTPGSELDHEAFKRGTSSYLGDRVIPMLPEELSNDLCSLRAGEDRLTMTAILEYDRNFNLRKKSFYPLFDKGGPPADLRAGGADA